MYLINYFNNELIDYKTTKEKVKIDENKFEEIEKQEPIFKINELEYKSSDKEFEYWLDIIQKSYGEFGEVTYKHIEDKPKPIDMEKELVSNLVKDNASIKERLKVQEDLNSTILLELAKRGDNNERI